MSDNQPPFCPHLTGVQILSFGLQGMLIPIGEAEVSGGSGMAALGQQLKRPASMGGSGGLDLSQMSKKLPVYQADLTAKFKRPTAELEQEKKDKKLLENPTLTPDTTLVPCQGPECAYWCPDHQACKQVCYDCQAQAFEKALRSYAENDQLNANTQGAEGPQQKEDPIDQLSPSS